MGITYGNCTICIRPYFEQASSGNTRQKHSVRLCLDIFGCVLDQGYRPNYLLKVLSNLYFYAFFVQFIVSIPKNDSLCINCEVNWNIY